MEWEQETLQHPDLFPHMALSYLTFTSPKHYISDGCLLSERISEFNCVYYPCEVAGALQLESDIRDQCWKQDTEVSSSCLGQRT